MDLQDQLFKLYIPTTNPLFVGYRRHASQLRIVGVLRSSNNNHSTLDKLIYRYYID